MFKQGGRFMARAITIFVLLTLTTSCVKKQIKQTTTTPFESISTQTIKTDVLTQETIGETDVRQERDISLETVYFDFDKYELKDESKEKLSKNAKEIIENKYSVTIEGHCDERGTNQYNLSLGQKRANVVKDYYIKLGVPANKIATISYGEEKPVCFEHNEECWAKNRRAETKIGK
jgi:peptidoglycan-associated lipoprotein